ncbi:MAG: hypothetical protein ACLQU3_05340 [Limisphaerales bacterium]
MKDLTDTRHVAACRQTTIANRQSAIPLKSAIGNRQSPVLALLCALASVALCVSAVAQSPTLIPYQGRLTNPQGVPYTNGQYTLAFTLYDQPVGGTVIWGPETHYKVGVINGMVNVFLGSINPITNVDFSQTRHLGITIYADNNPNNPAPEMVPRQMIIPAFWAKHSENSDKLAGYDWTPIFGPNNNPNSPLPGSKILSSSVTSTQIALQTITAAQIAPQTITSNQIAPQSVTAAQIANNTVTAAQIASNTITAGQIANSTIGSNQIAPGSIGTLQLAIGSVTQSNLAPRLVMTATNLTPGGVVMSASLGQQAVAGGTTNDLTNLTVTIATTGRPVFVGLVAAPNASYSCISLESKYSSFPGYPVNWAHGLVIFVRGGTNVIANLTAGFDAGSSDFNAYWPPSAFQVIDFPPAGTNTYKVRASADQNSADIIVQYVSLIAYEL